MSFCAVRSAELKKSILAFVIAMVSGTARVNAQDQVDSSKGFFHLAFGMGVDAHSAPSIVDYINTVARPATNQRLEEFASATEFFVAPEVRISPDWSLGVEYSLLLKNYLVNDIGGAQWEFSYQTHMPTLVMHYLMYGRGYWLKAGGGLGYYVGKFILRYPSSGSEDSYRARGLGMTLGAVANTEFDEHFYGYIAVDVRWSFAGELKNEAGLQPTYAGVTARMNFFSVGVKFGVMFQF